MRFKDRWAALVTGGTRPRTGEVFSLYLRTRRQWRNVVVTDVVDGWPGCWRVHKRFLGNGDEVHPMCVNAIRAQRAPSAMRQAAAGSRHHALELRFPDFEALYIGLGSGDRPVRRVPRCSRRHSGGSLLWSPPDLPCHPHVVIAGLAGVYAVSDRPDAAGSPTTDAGIGR